MPIEKIPIVHKFGIISQSQRLELQERLLKQSYINSYESQKAQILTRNPLEVTEEFIHQFNATENLSEQEKLEADAYKMLERVKRRAGLRDGGKGTHVDLPVAWTELSQLAQCKGKIQEDCLDVLITSLDQGPLHRNHIPALFFLAETCLYWLRTDAVNQPYLRTAELKLLKMGYVVFIRLFYHHMAGQLQRHDEFKNRLFTYLDGFGDCQEAYNPYPNALLYIRYINEVGKMILGTSAAQLDPGEMKEGDNLQVQESDTKTMSGMGATSDDEQEAPAPAPSRLSLHEFRNPLHRSSVIKTLFREVALHYDGHSSHSGAISSSVHDLSPSLWHSLDVWRCTQQLSGGLPDALRALAMCATGLSNESWVDGIGALHILADAAKVNLSALRVLQNLARGLPPPPETPVPKSNTDKHTSASHQADSSTLKSTSYVESKGLSDIYERTEEASAPSRKSHDRLKDFREDDEELPRPPGPSRPPPTAPYFEKTSSSLDPRASRQTDDTRINTGWKAEVGSAMDTGRASDASTVPTYTNELDSNATGLQAWHWEVAVTYTDLMADICLHGSTSEIQKMALIGCNKSINYIREQQPQCPMASAGLLDLVYFRARGETNDGTRNDWSWRIRYAGLQALVRLGQCCSSCSTKEGMHTTAVATLSKVHATERDSRVLEAFKIGQVDASIELMLAKHLIVPPSAIGAKIAAGLSALYLPPLPPPVNTPSPGKNSPAMKISPRRTAKPVKQKKPLRTTLKEEIDLATALYEPAVNYNARTNFDLKRVVEDQFRKDIQTELEEEEAERQKELKKHQVVQEEKEIISEDSRKKKLKDRYKGNKAYQIQHKASGEKLAPKKSSLEAKLSAVGVK